MLASESVAELRDALRHSGSAPGVHLQKITAAARKDPRISAVVVIECWAVFGAGNRYGGDVSPILVRPVREQLEHDRVIRLLPGRYKRRFDVGINPGAEQNAAIGVGTSAVYPDAVLYSTEKNRKIQGVVEVETVESINHLEVMSQWGPYSRSRSRSICTFPLPPSTSRAGCRAITT